MYRQRPPSPPWVRDEPAGGARPQHRAGWTACSRRKRARMSFCPKREPRGARPPPAPCASGSSDSCLIRARPAAWAVRIPPFPLSSSSHAFDWRARAHQSLGVRGGDLVQTTVRLLLGRRGREKAAVLCIKGMRRRERLPFRSCQQQTPQRPFISASFLRPAPLRSASFSSLFLCNPLPTITMASLPFPRRFQSQDQLDAVRRLLG
jgi:hypothetical protein